MRRKQSLGGAGTSANVNKPEPPAMEPVTVSIADACKATGLGRNSVYNLINDGKLVTVHIGRRQLVRVDSIKQLVGAA